MQEHCHETKRTNQFPLTFTNGTALMMVREDRQGSVMTAVSSKSGLVVSRCQNALPEPYILYFLFLLRCTVSYFQFITFTPGDLLAFICALFVFLCTSYHLLIQDASAPDPLYGMS